MARERWFYARENRRMGPFPRRQLVESLLGLPDPRACLVWRHGLQAWTPAGDVPEIERLLAPFAPAKEPEPAREAPNPALEATGRYERPTFPARPSAAAARSAKPALGPIVYGGVAVAVLVVGLIAWALWPSVEESVRVPRAGSSSPGPTSPGSSPGPSTGGSPRPGTAASPRPGGGGTGFVDQESDLPGTELKRLRGVAGWSGDKLTVTLYNGSNWRVTEIAVRTSRLEKDQFVDSVSPHRLLAGGVQMDAAVGELLKRVAPDRKKAGVNPADTGPFEGVVGAQPQAYRWKIEGARGYPPRSGS